ncbi:unnamed protein product, partial [Schistosoma mattheei]
MLYDQVTPRPNVWKAIISAIQECSAKTGWFVDTSLSVEEAWSVFKVPRRPDNSPPWITKPVRKLLSKRKKHWNLFISTGLEQYRSSYWKIRNKCKALIKNDAERAEALSEYFSKVFSVGNEEQPTIHRECDGSLMDPVVIKK